MSLFPTRSLFQTFVEKVLYLNNSPRIDSPKKVHAATGEHLPKKPNTNELTNIYADIAQFAKPNNTLAFISSAGTLLIFHILIAAELYFAANYCPATFSLRSPNWLLFIAFACFMGILKIRVFILFHDCGHGSFFSKKWMNRWMGRALGVSCGSPYYAWSRMHDYHHRHSNNNRYKQYSQTSPYTLSEFKSAPWYHQFFYVAIYNPFGLWFYTPTLYFTLYHSFISTKLEWAIRFAYHVISFYLAFTIIGCAVSDWLLYEFITYAVGGTIGVYLFHVQHTYNRNDDDEIPCNRKDDDKWDHFLNGVHGSSYLLVPWYMNWFTCNIQFHHLHHLNAKIPLYRLYDCHNYCLRKGLLQTKHVFQVTMAEATKFMPLSIYNRKTNRYENILNHIF